ncbi:HNH endonuclease [Ureibacillus chungkukjangi]|nr:HNH endonuclease [Ureibacillus chungkukjangi]
MESGAACNLYKSCTRCGIEKYYKKFSKKSSQKWRGICKACYKVKQRINTEKNMSLDYKDRVLKKGANIKVQLTKEKPYSYKITYENAVTLVEEGLAFVVHETKIFKPFSHKKIRIMIFERDSNICFYCGKQGATTLEHVIPRASGGLTTFSNCVVSCHSCNQKKGSLDFYDFINRVNTDLALERLRDSEKLIIERKLGIIHLLLQRVSEQVSKFYDGSIDNEEITFENLTEVENEVYSLKELMKNSNNESEKIS